MPANTPRHLPIPMSPRRYHRHHHVTMAPSAYRTVATFDAFSLFMMRHEERLYEDADIAYSRWRCHVIVDTPLSYHLLSAA